MFDLNEWLQDYTKLIKKTFSDRVIFIGIQGSYARSEATPLSDIDVVLILDKLSVNDLKNYSKAIANLSARERICGFVSGIDELRNWAPADLFQFYYDTKPILGNIDFILPLIKKCDIKQAVHMGACNIYHMCVHNVAHERNAEILKDLYKSAVFVLQAKHFLATQEYISKKADLLTALQESDLHILQSALKLKQESDITEEHLDKASDSLLKWTSYLITHL